MTSPIQVVRNVLREYLEVHASGSADDYSDEVNKALKALTSIEKQLEAGDELYKQLSRARNFLMDTTCTASMLEDITEVLATYNSVRERGV
jgi:hypothetical protein